MAHRAQIVWRGEANQLRGWGTPDTNVDEKGGKCKNKNGTPGTKQSVGGR